MGKVIENPQHQIMLRSLFVNGDIMMVNDTQFDQCLALNFGGIQAIVMEIFKLCTHKGNSLLLKFVCVYFPKNNKYIQVMEFQNCFNDEPLKRS
jgi:hypothetical protein